MDDRNLAACGCLALMLLAVTAVMLAAGGAWYVYMSDRVKPPAPPVEQEPSVTIIPSVATIASGDTPPRPRWEIVPFAATPPGTPELTAAVDNLSRLVELLNTLPLIDEDSRPFFPRTQAEWEKWRQQYAEKIPPELILTPWGNEVEYIFTDNHHSYMLNIYDGEGRLAVSYLGGASHRVGPIPYQAPAMLKTPVGTATGNFIWNHNSWGSSVHNLVTDAMREMTGSDVAIMTFLGIRANIPKGTVTREHLGYVLPFGNSAVVVEMTGDQLMGVINHSLQMANPFTYSGIYVTENGDYLTTDGNWINEHAIYRVALSSYQATGGRYNEFAQFATFRQCNGDRRLLTDLVADYISHHTPITPDLTERLRVTATTVNQ